MKSYLVGGAVRDKLLGIAATERDWVVVGASEQMMLDQGFKHLDADFPVFIHPKTGDEYALARREIKTGAGYKGFTIQASPDVTLEQDLSRRDLTINAIAEDSNGALIDPYRGQQDLRERTLRHITPAFIEDPVRVLRVARFAAHLGEYDFQIAPETLRLMQQMSREEDFSHLKRERVWREFKRALATSAPWRFIAVLHQCQALSPLMPLLEQHYETAITTLKRASTLSDDPIVRFAALFYWPVVNEGADVKALCQTLRAERCFSEGLERVVKNTALLTNLSMDDADEVLKLFQQNRAIKGPQTFDQLLQLISILWPEKTQLSHWLAALLPAVSAISTKSLQADGLQGRALGEALQQARLQLIKNFPTAI